MNKYLYFPNEILNIIFSYVERPKHANMILNVIKNGYKEDYNPFTAEQFTDNYCFQYHFSEWYYLYRIQTKLGGINTKHNIKKNNQLYKHTPNLLLIGINKIKS